MKQLEKEERAKYIKCIEIVGRASLIAGYDEELENAIRERMAAEDEDEEGYGFSLEDDFEEELGDFYEDAYDGWSWEMDDELLDIKVTDGNDDVMEFHNIRPKIIPGKTHPSQKGKLLRCSSTKYAEVELDLEDREGTGLYIGEQFNIHKLAIIENKYHVNGERFSTLAELSYDGKSLGCGMAVGGCDEDYADYQFDY